MEGCKESLTLAYRGRLQHWDALAVADCICHSSESHEALERYGGTFTTDRRKRTRMNNKLFEHQNGF